jgi:DNA-nicking Smr family endonuclease
MARRRHLSSDERALWRTVTRSIRPLGHAQAADSASGWKDDGQSDRAAATRPADAPEAAVRRKPAQPVTAPPLAPIEPRLRHRVARGTLAIDARLDLHGMTQRRAHAALVAFLRRQQANGARLILVITGKGRRGSEEGGVLQRQVPLWLEDEDLRPLVLGFERAAAAHGGEGALYVRIRRRK